MHVATPIRLAGSSFAALLIFSIPGLNHLPTPELQPLVSQPVSQTAPAPRPKVARRRFSLIPRVTMTGIASWYGAVLQGHTTASGEVFDMNKMTACHRTLPFGTMVRVVDTHTKKSVIVKINDRGVLFADRVIDLSRAAAESLGIRSAGVANVRLEVLTKQQAEALQFASATIPASPSSADPEPSPAP